MKGKPGKKEEKRKQGRGRKPAAASGPARVRKALGEALKRIKPSVQEERALDARISETLERIRKAIPEAKTVLGGSGEKGTWLRNAHDADLFVMFPAAYKGKDLSAIVERKLGKIFPLERLHGSRDYFRVRKEGFIFEIVPIIAIRKAEEAENITDVSPLHARWVKARIGKKKGLADEIRLAKQFLKAGRVYGAESYINGFSGYICEVLTLHYGSFEKLARAMSAWKPKTLIDPAKAYKGRNILFELDKAKTQGPLVVVDPVQAGRNAAAAVSDETYGKARAWAVGFLKHPSSSFFEEKELDEGEVRKLAGRDEAYLFEAVAQEGKEDIVGCRLMKVFEHLKAQTLKAGFTLLRADWDWGKRARFALVVRKGKLPPEMVVGGPPERMRKHAGAFREKHQGAFLKAGRWWAKERREHVSPASLMRSFLKDPYVRERVKSISLKVEG